MRKFVFIFILGLIGCSDNMKDDHTIMVSEKKSIEIKEYITNRISNKQIVDLKGKYGTNLRGLKLTGANLSGVDLSGVDLSESSIARV
ncbi:MAG: pentapeptide repeat-containing protein, partial [Rickettsiaceae bacterium]|nr:pentapeptide repeat-containing protein [Rickettsiaceae bacterium]